jgi:cAMP-dependent protein kinase regulator
MSADIQKLKDEAASLTGKGKLDEAEQVWLRITRQTPEDLQAYGRLAELYVQKKQNEQAILWYGAAAKRSAEQGQLPKAIAIAKLILEIEPKHQQTQAFLASLYGRRPAQPPAAPPAKLETPKPAAEEPAPAFIGIPDEDDAYFHASVSIDEPEAEDIVELELTTEDEEILTLVEEAEDDVLDGIPAGPSREEVLERLPRVPLFSDLGPAEFLRLIDHVEVRVFSPGETVIEEGQQGEAFFIITAGRANVTKRLGAGKPVVLAQLGESAFFGEFAYLTGGARTASVVAEGELEVLEISREHMDQLVAEHPRVKNVLQKFYRDRVLKTLLTISPVFRPLAPDERTKAVKHFSYESTAANEVIIREGEPGTALYVIVRGTVAVTQAAPDGELPLAQLHEGDFFGEMAVLSGAPTSATVRAVTKTGLLKIQAAQLEALGAAYPAVMDVLRAQAQERRSLNLALREELGIL